VHRILSVLLTKAEENAYEDSDAEPEERSTPGTTRRDAVNQLVDTHAQGEGTQGWTEAARTTATPVQVLSPWRVTWPDERSAMVSTAC
jgi:hypothetical protein